MPQEIDQQPHANACRADRGVGFVGIRPSRAGDVEVCPGEVLDVSLEKSSGGECARGTPPRVFEVRDLAFDEVPVIVEDGQMPCAFARAVARLVDLGDEIVVIAHQAAGFVAKRDDARAGERGEIDSGFGVVARTVCEGVDEDEAAFGVRATNLDGFLAQGMQDVAGAIGPAVGHVFRCGDQADDALGKIEFCHGAHRTNDSGRAAHVEFHIPHAFAAFEGNAARVKGDALADEDDGRGFGIGARVF